MEQDQNPTFNFTFDEALSEFDSVRDTYMSDTRPSAPFRFHFCVVGAVIFSKIEPGKILLIQRAATDSLPNRWEIPGGACDPGETLLQGAARELWEEAGLTATKFTALVGGPQYDVWYRAELLCKFSFAAEWEGEVKLDPKEHQAYLWVSEEEFNARKVGDVELKITMKSQTAVIKEAFKMLNKVETQTD